MYGISRQSETFVARTNGGMTMRHNHLFGCLKLTPTRRKCVFINFPRFHYKSVLICARADSFSIFKINLKYRYFWKLFAFTVRTIKKLYHSRPLFYALKMVKLMVWIFLGGPPRMNIKNAAIYILTRKS